MARALNVKSLAVAAIGLAACLLSTAPLAAGELDPSFGRGGRHIVGWGGGPDSLRAIKRLPDGSFIVGGFGDNGVSRYLAAVHWMADGNVDNSFGDQGKLALKLPFIGADIRDVAVDNAGRFVFAGRANDGTFDRMLVVRFNSDGSLDTTLAGIGYTIVSANFGNAHANGVAIDVSDGILLAGSYFNGVHDEIAVARLLDSGLIDDTFGSSGVAVTNYVNNGEGTAIAIDSAGRIVVGGTCAITSGDPDACVTRFSSTGTLDASFNGTGMSLVGFPGVADSVTSIALDPLDRIILGGYQQISPPWAAFVQRIATNGLRDPTFNSGSGFRLGLSGFGNERVFAVAADGTSRVLFAGTVDTSSPNFYLLGALLANGTGLDTTFNATQGYHLGQYGFCNSQAGKSLALTPTEIILGLEVDCGSLDFVGQRYSRANGDSLVPFGPGDSAFADVVPAQARIVGIVREGDGRLVAGGNVQDMATGQNRLTVMRLNEDGSYDLTYGTDGRADIGPIGNASVVTAVLGLGSVVGGTDNTLSAQLVRYTEFGTLDASFGSGGVVSAGAGFMSFVNGVAFQPDAKIVFSGSALGQAFVGRLLPSGAADTTFGGALGIVFNNTFFAGPVAIDSAGFILVACRTNTYDLCVARYLPDGTLDTSFGISGNGIATLTVPISTGALLVPTAITIQDTGKIVVAAGTQFDPDASFVMARFHGNGFPDFGFGASGVVMETFTGFGVTSIGGIASQPDGRLVLVGRANNFNDPPFVARKVHRYLPNGAIDPIYAPFESTVLTSADFTGVGIDPATSKATVVGIEDEQVDTLRFIGSPSGSVVVTVNASATTVGTSGSSTITFTITNQSGVPVDSLVTMQSLGGALVHRAPATTTCPASISGPTGSSGWALSGTPAGVLGVGASCTVTLTVGSATATSGPVSVNRFNLTTSQGFLSLTNASVSITVVASAIPASASAAAGAVQTAAVGNQFATPLQVLVRDAGNAPAPGVSVTFSAPAFAPNAMLSATNVVTDSNGLATITATAAGYFGSYTVTATVAGLGTPVTFALTNLGSDAQLTATQIAFGNRNVNTTNNAAPVTLKNIGNATMSIASIAASGAGFSVTSNCPANLAIQATCTLNIAFAPAAEGQVTGQVNIASSGVFSPNKILLAGNGIDLTNPAGDADGDGVPNGVEASVNLNPLSKDNDVFNSPRLFAMQQYRDFLGREGDAGGIEFYITALNTGTSRAQVIENFFNSPEFGGVVAPVTRLYFAFFNRIPDYPGLIFQVNAYRSGTPLATIASNFSLSPEFLATYGTLNNTQYVTLLYQNVLGRAPVQAEINFYLNLLNTGTSRGQVMLNFSESPENIARKFNAVYVTNMYVGMLRRAPEQAGFDYWVAYMAAGSSGQALIAGFLNAPEYRNRFLP